MSGLFTREGVPLLVAVALGFGFVAGLSAYLWGTALTQPRSHNRTARLPAKRLPAVAAGIATALLFAVYVLAVVRFECQQVAEVRPDDFSRYARVLYHLVLLTLLVAATTTDLRESVIPDAITITGMIIGLTGAAASGQLQLIHIWVDWNQEIPGLAGPYIPAWLDAHRHLHGLAWSAAGGIAGAGLTWVVRWISSRLLGREALGLGDVTLMAMIGTFIGWQPVVMVFVLAPICGLAFVLPMRAISGSRELPYGPFLAAATVLVLFAWRPLWLSTRLVFGHPPTIAILSLATSAVFVLLLVALRFYRGDRR